MSKADFNLLFMKALKSAAKTTRTYDEKVGRYARVPTELRPTIKQRAKWQSTEMAKPGGSHVFIKYDNIHAPHYKGERIYQLSKADVKKWEKEHFEPSLIGTRIGKPVFEMYQGVWHHFPHDFYGRGSSVSISSADGDIVRHFALNFDTYGRHGIKAAIQRSFDAKPNDMRHYKALLAESKKTGLPTRFKDDVIKHDKRSLTHRDPSLPFGWVLRDDGTHLVFPEAEYDGRQPSFFVDSMMKSFGAPGSLNPNLTFYAWDGTKLSRKTPAAMKEWLNDEHRKANR